MRNVTIEGFGKLPAGEYGKVVIEGVASCDGDLRAQEIHIDGKFKCAGGLFADVLDCDGMAECSDIVEVEHLDVDGLLTISGDGQINASRIECDGAIRMRGQVSADVIHADGMIHADEIVGDEVEIESLHTPHIPFLQSLTKHLSNIGLIEATTIRISGVFARQVNGHDIDIGSGCEIERVDCTGTLRIDPTAKVGEITGEYQHLDM